jgi:hypothetical protein
MMRFKLAAFFILIFGTDYAAAQDYSCQVESDGRITLSGDTSNINASIMRRCTNIPVQGARYTMKAFGYCKGEPNAGIGYSNCYTLIDDPITVEFSENSSQSFEAKLPPIGEYSHYFSIIERDYELAAVVELTNDVSTVSGEGFFSTKIVPGALDECPSNPCSAPFSAIENVDDIRSINDPQVVSRPETNPGYVPFATIRVDTLSPYTNVRKFVLLEGNLTVRLLNGKLGPVNASTFGTTGVNYVMSSIELDEPFVVNGDETRATVDFDLSTGANFLYYFNDPTSLGDGFNRHWNIPLIYLSQRAFTPTIQTSTD